MSSFRQTQHPILKPIPLDEIKRYVTVNGQIDSDRVVEIHRKIQEREDTLKLAEGDPLNHGFTLPHWEDAEDILTKKTSVVALGGNRCYDAETTYIYDPVAGEQLKASEIQSDFHCHAIDIDGNVVVAKAEKPYSKGFEEMYEVFFDDGSSMTVTPAHEFLLEDHSTVALKDVEIGGLVLGYEAQSQSFPPHTQGACGQHHSEEVSDSQCDYHSCRDLCGERPLLCGENDLYSSPSLADAQEHSPETCNSDDLFAIYSDSLSLSSLRPWESLSSAQSEGRPLDTKTEKSQVPDQRQKSSYHEQSSQKAPSCDCQSTYLPPDSASCPSVRSQSCEQPCPKTQSQKQSPGSFCHQEQASELGRNHISSYLPYLTIKRVVSIKSRGIKKIYDHSVPEHGNYLANGVISKNSGKTEWGARSIVKAAKENAGSIIVCFAQDADASIRVQQAAVYRYLPPDLKKKQKGQIEYVNYTTKNGFTGASLILPNGSQILFHTYSQFISNRSKFEGLELGSKNPKWLNIGLWLDEYLEDGDLVETMRFRLATRNALMLITVTPIDGYTPFIASFLKDAEIKKTRPAELLDGEEVPLVQVCKKKDAGIVYFHSQLNPFGGYERIAKELKHSTRDEILTRAYGIPVKSMTTLFPLFSSNVHVKDENPELSPSKHTIYHIVDPASARNYVSIWAAVDSNGEVSILREFPDRDTYGPWAEFGDPKWKFGPASKKMGYNVKGYVDLFTEIEESLGINDKFLIERVGDSRFFAAEDSDNVDLFTAFAEHGMDFIPSDGRQEDMGIAKVDEYFHYNPNVEVDGANKPLMTINKDCGNLIYTIMNYGQNGKKDEPLKDFCDLLRYLVMTNAGEGPMHFGENSLKQKASGGAY